MKELILSTLEKEFILKAIAERTRLDGREANAYRDIRISFGEDHGCCFVTIGETKVMAQISYEVAVPKDARPNEGSLMINVELSPMAAPRFEAGRPSYESVEINRLLERCLRDSRCVDTESLCIVSGRKVWEVRIDVHVLNYDGNVVDASSVAAIAALCHSRRPDISVCGDDITIHTLQERDPIPLSIFHMPVCTTFAFFDVGKFMVIDPTEREEAVANGALVIAMNKHREICLLKMTGDMLLLQEQVIRCSNIAAMKVAAITELIQTALQNDKEARKTGKQGSASMSADTEPVTSIINRRSQPVDVNGAEQNAKLTISRAAIKTDRITPTEQGDVVTILDSGVATIGEGGIDSWQECKIDVNLSTIAQPQVIEVDHDSDYSGSEEDDVVIINK